LIVVRLDFIGTESPLKLSDLCCWLTLSLPILPLLSTSLLIEDAMDRFFLHGEKYVIVFAFVCFSLMSLNLFLALLFNFAQECKRLSVGGFDVSLFSPIS